MPELTLAAPPPRDELLRALALQLPATLRMRVVARDLLGAASAIDLLCLEPEGRAVLVLVGETERDLELLGRGLAQRAWVAARLGDWLQLAPDLGVRPEAGVRVLLLAPAFGPEAEAAAAALGADAPELWRMHSVRNGAGVAVLLEPLRSAPVGAAARPERAPRAAPGAAPRPTFRTQLTEADLGLTPAERREFE